MADMADVADVADVTLAVGHRQPISQVKTEQMDYSPSRGRDFLQHEQASEFCEAMVLGLIDIYCQVYA
jgi:hypothetical protein